MENTDPRTYAIIGAAMEVHKELGSGFLEAVYQEALTLEFDRRHITYVGQLELPIFFKGIRLAAHYRADFVCFGEIVVEIKALEKLGSVEAAQLLNYLKASDLEIGLLLNFGAPSLEYKRFILSQKKDQINKSVQSA
jgi:GxxExxY protein